MNHAFAIEAAEYVGIFACNLTFYFTRFAYHGFTLYVHVAVEHTIDADISKLDSLDDEDFDDDSTERLSPENARKMLKKLTELRRVFGEIGNFVDKLGNLCEKVDNEGADKSTVKPATATNE